MTAPLVSVVICTHNRAARLPAAMASVLAQRSDVPFELLVVDNASADETPAVVQGFTHPRVRYLREPVLGLCRARNAGWRAARGRYVAYLDDDAVAEPAWLDALTAVFAAVPDAGVVGGRVWPLWEAERPAWLSDEIALGLTIVDWSERRKDLVDLRREWLVGANMAIPAAVLAEVGGFRPELDRIGAKLLTGGDVFLQKRIVERGYRCVYEPAMAIGHVVPADRVDKAWFRRRYYWQGISDAVMWLLESDRSRAWRLRRAVRTLAALLRSPRLVASIALPTDDPRRFTEQCLSWITVGQVAGLLGAGGR
jgi:glucosyl-dolichyl phosphate glucuronosyltransferase